MTLIKIHHKGIRTSVKTIVGYKSRFLKYDDATSRMSAISDVVMNSTEMSMGDLVIIHRLIQAWSSQHYRPLRNEVDGLRPQINGNKNG